MPFYLRVRAGLNGFNKSGASTAAAEDVEKNGFAAPASSIPTDKNGVGGFHNPAFVGSSTDLHEAS